MGAKLTLHAASIRVVFQEVPDSLRKAALKRGRNPLIPSSNIIRAVEGNPLAAEFVEFANRRNAIQDAYRIDGNRVALFTISDQRELEEIRVRLLWLWAQLND